MYGRIYCIHIDDGVMADVPIQNVSLELNPGSHCTLQMMRLGIELYDGVTGVSELTVSYTAT